MDQGGFDFNVPAVDPREVSASGQALPPVNGTTSAARHASWTGAVHAMEHRGEKVRALRALFESRGPLTLQQAAEMTGWPLSSICSLKAALGDDLEADGYEVTRWGHGKTTKRTRWRVKR